MARLMIFDELMRGVDLPGHAIIVGRSRRVDLPIRDRILSRKHCSIVPMDSGFSIVDLKSQNGTFVNGERIDKADLEYDDVIEIGETVIVILDTDSWNRGEGLTRLRNPVKAQELIQKINKSSVPVSGLDPRVPGEAMEAAGRPSPALEDGLLEDLVIRELSQALLKKSPQHQSRVEEVVRELLSDGWEGKGLAETRARARELLVALEEGESSAAGARAEAGDSESADGESEKSE